MKLKEVSKTLKYKLAAASVVAAPLVGTAAAEINWTDITSVIDGMGTYLIPSFVTLVTAAVPLLITMAVVGFVMGFMDSILGMINRFR
jgi:hypothetical protein